VVDLAALSGDLGKFSTEQSDGRMNESSFYTTRDSQDHGFAWPRGEGFLSLPSSWLRPYTKPDEQEKSMRVCLVRILCDSSAFRNEDPMRQM
jgi:hypothetical protein